MALVLVVMVGAAFAEACAAGRMFQHDTAAWPGQGPPFVQPGHVYWQPYLIGPRIVAGIFGGCHPSLHMNFMASAAWFKLVGLLPKMSSLHSTSNRPVVCVGVHFSFCWLQATMISLGTTWVAVPPEAGAAQHMLALP